MVWRIREINNHPEFKNLTVTEKKELLSSKTIELPLECKKNPYMPLNFIAHKEEPKEEEKDDTKNEEDQKDTQLKVLKSGINNLRER